MIVVSAIEVGDPPPRACLQVSSLEDSVDVLSAAWSDVLLVCSADELSRASRITRAVLGQPNVGLVTVGGTPTQRAAAVRFIESLSTDSYGIAQDLADAVRSACVTRLALTSVSGLVGAKPSVWQHLRSWFPGASFDVDLTSGKVESSKEIVWTPPPGALLCSASSAETPHLRVRVQGAEPGLVLAPSKAKQFGAKEWFELTVINDARRITAQVLGSAQSVCCRGCTRVVPPTICPFCGSVQSHRGASDPVGRRYR